MPEQITFPRLRELLDAGAQLVDVLPEREYLEEHLDGAINIPLKHLLARVAEVPRDRLLVVHCAGGYRSSIAASILQREGIEMVEELSGGIASWEAAGQPVLATSALAPGATS